jgi:hypothetical protein
MRLKACLAAFTAAVLTVFAGPPALAQAPAGDAVCAQCHAPAVASFALGKHAVHGDRRTPAGSGAGCQSCHTGASRARGRPDERQTADVRQRRDRGRGERGVRELS